MYVFKKKLYDAIFDYLNESMSDTNANEQAMNMVDQIIELDTEINQMFLSEEVDTSLLSKKFHTLKNLLLYGDFYYESDLCQDIEETLRTTKDIKTVIELNNELQSSLKM
jgi:hypothetical protein